jgi:membrane protein implicated in regulation of membrane protease activity
MDNPDTWRWVWLVTAAFFAIGEMMTPGALVMLPFAVGALMAALLGVLDVALWVQWVAFVIVSGTSLVALRPLARRLDRHTSDDGVGARRLLGQEATVLQEIPGGGELGLVRVNREEWRAESTGGEPIPAGTHVRVADVRGTRVVVAQLDTMPPTTSGQQR